MKRARRTILVNGQPIEVLAEGTSFDLDCRVVLYILANIPDSCLRRREEGWVLQRKGQADVAVSVEEGWSSRRQHG